MHILLNSGQISDELRIFRDERCGRKDDFFVRTEEFLRFFLELRAYFHNFNKFLEGAAVTAGFLMTTHND